MPTTPPTRHALRILTAIVTRPAAPGTRPCAAGLTPHDPPGPCRLCIRLALEAEQH